MLLATLGLLLAVHLGPETPIGLRTFGAAASGQYEPAAAWNGHTGLAVWSDSRGTYPADTSPVRDYVESMLRVSPMRADGSLVNPGGTELFAGWNAHLASNGSSFMLAYSDRKGIHVVPLNESGMPDGVDTLVSTSFTSDYSIVSNGHTFFFVGSTDGSTLEAVVFRPSGVPYSLKTFSTGPSAPWASAATVIGDVYAIAYRDPAIHLALLAEDAATTDQVVLSGDDTYGALSLAASDDRLLLALIGAGNVPSVRTLIAGRDGKAITPLKTVMTGPTDADGAQPAYWDGENFLVTWRVPANAIQTVDERPIDAVRVSPNNDVLDTSPAVIARNSPYNLTFTRTSEGTVAIWSAGSDVLRRTFASTGELFTQPANATAEVLSVRAQTETALGAFGSEPLRVWREGSLDVHIMLAIGGKIVDVAGTTEHDLRDPSVARGGNVVLVFWRELWTKTDPLAISTSGYRTYARRFALDGAPLDAQPFLVGNGDSEYVEIELGTATAFDGRNFIALWSGSSWSGTAGQPAIRATRISPSGTLVDATPFFIAGPADLAISSGVRALWTGSELLVAWSSWIDYRGILISPRPAPRDAAEIVRLDTRGNSMKVIGARAVWQDAGLSKSVGLAWNGTNALLTSVHRNCVEATLLDANLATLKNVASVECVAPFSYLERPAAAWTGSEFVIAWSARTVHAMRFDRTLQALDDAPFDVAPQGVIAYEPAIAASGPGAELTYVRFDDDVPRLFARTLDRLGVIPRGRPTGH